jgi:rubrerythrin
MSYDNDLMNEKGIEFTTYDRLLRAWENSMEMVRDFEMYSKRIEDEKVKSIFKKFAEDEGMHASQLKELVIEYRNKEKQ